MHQRATTFQRRVLGLALLLVAAGGCGARQQTTNLPDVELQPLDGSFWRLTDEAGQVVVLVFFATFDNSSVVLSTSLERLHITFADRGVRVIGVAMDPADAPQRRQLVETFCAMNNLTFDILLGSNELGRGETALGRIPSIPATVIFDQRGDPVASATGVFEEDELASLLEALLEGRAHPLLTRPR